jgi:hypothetical protein
MSRTTDRRMLHAGLFVLAAAACTGGTTGGAKAQGACPDDGGGFPKACTKEIRIWNNTDGPLYAILQASIQTTDALDCTKADKGGGDVWLQAALGDTKKCYAVKNNYYAYINPVSGIPKGGFASINVPWWSKRRVGAPDTYIDWWRGARVIFFDDQNALNDSYAKLKNDPQVDFADGSPKVNCNNVDGNACKQLQVFQVTAEATIGTQTPYQLNEFTFAAVSEVTDNGKKGGEFINFNQGYNVSNVDQLYLPLAIGPVRDPADVGYMGTTMSVAKFRKQLADFTGTDTNPDNPVWPIYNNPTVKGKKAYPNAGIRVPSTQTVFNYYMNPFFFPGTKTPQIIPNNPPKLITDLRDQWTSCTASSPKGCPQSAIYKEINSAFLDSYKNYVKICNDIPDFLKPVQKNPPMPELGAFLTYVYGWVPFNFNCANDPLPTADQPPAGSRVPIDYMSVQYNYEDQSLKPKQWFNPYTQLIHDSIQAGGLSANAYAFSIDDHSSFQSNDGGSLPGGLIFAVGGSNGLQNKNQVPPPTPPVYKYFDFSVNLGAPNAGAPYWLKYGICSDTADTFFPGRATDGYGLGIDPAIEKISNSKPCKITLMDSSKRKYRMVILKADVPPNAIWPKFKPDAQSNFDPNVLACPAENGFVAPEDWCNFTNETADPTPPPGIYSISTRVPLTLAKTKR